MLFFLIFCAAKYIYTTPQYIYIIIYTTPQYFLVFASCLPQRTCSNFLVDFHYLLKNITELFSGIHCQENNFFKSTAGKTITSFIRPGR